MICPRCGKENGDDARFCNDCAAPLADAATASGEERKIVSILFCDLVGFTAASEDADPEDVRARIRPYHASLRHELERYGGTVEKFIGDAVMAVFGAPVAHEDDPERAVRAGLRIIEAIAELNEREPDLDLQVRVGINTGPAVVSLQARPERGEGFVAGDVVNTAARIQAAAPVNEVAVSQETFRQTERVITYEPLAEVDAKGKSAPVRLYRAIEARARFGADLIRTQETLFVGREVEKTLLQGLFDRCARDSTVELVTLVGEPGVGKSRLCAELYRYTDERPALIRWRQGRCLPYGEGITFWALGELVKSHAGIFESDSPDAAMTKLDEALPEVEERDWLRARLLPLLGIDSGGSESREESFAAWRRFVESIASDGPAVVVVEDLHWADPPLLDFLSYFSEWAGGVPLLLVCTARPELFEKHGSWGARTRNAHTINLSPLSENETSELVQGLLEQSVSEQVRQTILERAGGNPLYAEEFVRLVADRGLADTSEGVAFPDSVQALIAARLDTLSPDRKGLLQDAAVVGKVFWSGALAAMGGLDERESSSRSTSCPVGSWYGPHDEPPWSAKASTRSGTSSSATSHTDRFRAPRAPESIAPPPCGWRKRQGNVSRISLTCSPITTRRRSISPEPPATRSSWTSFSPPHAACSSLPVTGPRRSTLRRQRAFTDGPSRSMTATAWRRRHCS